MEVVDSTGTKVNGMVTEVVEAIEVLSVMLSSSDDVIMVGLTTTVGVGLVEVVTSSVLPA